MKSSFIGSLDRIEGDTAVVITDGDGHVVHISAALLPENAKEGDIISFKLAVKDKKTGEKKAEVTDMIDKLRNKG